MDKFNTLQWACTEKCRCEKCQRNLDEWCKNCNLSEKEYYQYFQISENEIPVYGACEYLDDKIRKMASVIYRKKVSKGLKTKSPVFISLVIKDLMKTFDEVKKELLKSHLESWHTISIMERDGKLKVNYNQLRKDFLNEKYK